MQATFPPAGSTDPQQIIIDTLQAELYDIFQVERIQQRRNGSAITFIGRFLHDIQEVFDVVQHRFSQHGYTPLLRKEKGEEVIVALPGLAGEARNRNPLINILLFLATVFTTLAAGAILAGAGDVISLVLAGEILSLLPLLWQGAPFALALLSILTVHELGHFFAARAHGVAASLPYFIPLPPISPSFVGLGTLGAFITIRSPMKNRKVLFDIGLAGPLAGLVVAVPLLVAGLYLSEPVPYFSPGLTLRFLGSSLLTQTLSAVLVEVPAGQTLALHPVYFAAWFGLLITGINLLPIGQLDGGHVSYGLLGRHAHKVAQAAFLLLLLAGLLVNTSWLFWAFFVLLGGLRHAPPMNDITGLNLPRLLLAGFATLLFFLLFVPHPFGN
jgi:membrane-associated protease RseP (regulator of RpoE activity)